MFTRLKNLIKSGDSAWRGAQLSKVALGKYIVLFASVLHLGWAGILAFADGASGSTPVSAIEAVAGGEARAAFVLFVVAAMAMVFPFIKRPTASPYTLPLLLLPQQTLLLLSAGAGLWAAIKEEYADGVLRGWEFILADQLGMILLAVMYTVVVIEAAFEPYRIILPEAIAAKLLNHQGEE